MRITGRHGLQQRIGRNSRCLARTQTCLTKDDTLCSPLRKILNQLDPEGMKTANATYASLVRWCGDENALLDGRSVHARIIASGRDGNTFLANLLVQMYGKCGSVKDARNVFIKIRQPDLFSWSFMIAAYAQNGHEGEALQLSRDMQMRGVKPNKFTFFPILSACANLRALADGKRVHEHIVASGFDSEVALRNALVNMYGKCGSPKDARFVFDEMQERDVVSWNAMIAAYAQNGQSKEALKLFRQMDVDGIELDRITFLNILNAFAGLASLDDGKMIHKRIVASDFESDVAVRTAIVTMYGRCCSPKDARSVFDKMHERDVILWNAMIAAYAQNDQGNEALELFGQMNKKGVVPDRITFLSILDACANLASLENGKVIHKCIVARQFESDIAVRNALVNMYGKCGSLNDARVVFGEMCNRNVISWTAMIAAYAKNGQGKEAIELFRKMNIEGVKPNSITFLSLLDACASLASLEIGRGTHECIVASGFESDVTVRNALINMYGKCGSVKDARLVFDEMHERGVISWNAMSAAYALNGQGKEALELLRQMDVEGIKPNRNTFLSILTAFTSLASLEYGRAVHEYIVANAFECDVAVRTALVNMYGKCGNPKDAQLVFDGMHERDLISWNAMIAAYAQNGLGKEALKLFRQMDVEGVKPDRITFLSILDACASLASLENGRTIHECIVATGLKSDVAVGNALVTMYGKCGNPKDAWVVFSEMHQRDVISWTAMIGAYAQNGQGREAVELFWQMDFEGVNPTIITFLSILEACASLASLENGRAIHKHIVISGFEYDVTVRTSLISMYGKCGSLKDAQSIFDKMHKQDVTLWNAMIAAYAQNGQAKEALKLFQQMDLEGIKPDRITFLSILNALASLASLEHGRMIHERIVSCGFESDVAVRNALVNTYGKCGSLEDARWVFGEMHERDVISWNAMIAAYGQNGQGREALELFQQMNMEGVKPDRITFLSIISACSHAGLLDEGWEYFISMNSNYGITPLLEHYVCMIDLLGRAGFLDEAEDLINSMPVQPSVVAWNTLLGACRIHGNMEQGTHAAKHVSELDPKNASPYVLLSNIYAAAGKWNGAI